jgi:hypothetical protein
LIENHTLGAHRFQRAFGRRLFLFKKSLAESTLEAMRT